MKRSARLRLESLILNAASICHDFGDEFVDVAKHEGRRGKRTEILHELQCISDLFDSKLNRVKNTINQYAGNVKEMI